MKNQKGITSSLAIIIVIVIGVLVIGGVLAYQYLWAPEEKPEEGLEEEGPYIKVISPNGGEEFEIGEDIPVKWIASGVERVMLDLQDEKDVSHGKLSSFPISNTGSFLLTATYNLSPGKYRIRAFICPDEFADKECWYDIENLRIYGYDESDDYFGIVKKKEEAITVISPNGGEKWQIGERHLIKLTDQPVKCRGESSDCTVYSIQLIDESGNYVGTISCGYFTPYEAVSKIKTEIEWDILTVLEACGAGVPTHEIKPGNYKIRIADRYSSEIVDESDNYFSIVEE